MERIKDKILYLISRQESWSAIGKFFELGITFLTLSLLSRLLSAEELGYYFVFVSLITICSFVFLFGTNGIIPRIVGRWSSGTFGDSYGKIVVSVYRFCLIPATIIVLFELIISYLFNLLPSILPNQSVLLVRFSIYALVLATVTWEILLAFVKIKWMETVRVFIPKGGMFICCLAIYFYGKKVDLNGIILITCILYFAAFICGSYVLVSKKTERPECTDTSAFSIWPMYKRSPYVWISFVAIIILSHFDNLVISRFYSPDSVSSYALALRISQLAEVPLLIVNGFIPGIAAKLFYSGKIPELEDVVRKYTKYSALASCVIVLTVVNSIELFEFYLGNGIIDIDRFVVVALSLGFFSGAVFGPVGLLLLILGFEDKVSMVYFVVVATKIAATITIASFGTIEQYAVACSLFTISINSTFFLLVRKNIKIITTPKMVFMKK